MRASYAYGISFFSIAFLLSLWLLFPFFPVFWLFIFIALATTPTVYVYSVGPDEPEQRTDRMDLKPVALHF
jgi:hypothetical protein|tara:strand:- start:1330 stop:1542 length:213 start_codon:yes stop_codon:yes gene_type:complete